MPEAYESAGSDPVPGAARPSLADLGPAALQTLPTKPARPTGQLTRFAVMLDEYRALLTAAQQPQPAAPAAPGALAAVEDAATAEEDQAALVMMLDVPEGQVAAAPAAAAPTITRSFEGLPQ